MSRILLRGFRLLDPSSGLDEVQDVLVEDGRIAALGTGLDAREVVPGEGCWLVPGLLDLHVHLRSPGEEHKETLATGLSAARRGGFTAVGAMANTLPPIDTAAKVQALEQAVPKVGVRVYQYGAATVGLKGEEPADYAAYRAAGVRAVSDDGRGLHDSGVMRQVLTEAGRHDLLVIVHEEDRRLSRGAPVNEGPSCLRLGVPGQPAAAEASMLARDLALLWEFGGRLHVAHVSTAASVALLRWAKGQGLRVSAEVTPHHLFLGDEAVLVLGAHAKMNPPLRGARDRQVLLGAFLDGTLDALATDHAPHTREEKERGLEAAPFGVVGLETALALVLDRLVRPGLLSPLAMVERMSIAPRRILGLAPPRLEVGERAELTAIDPERRWTVVPEDLATLARHTPFAGWTLQGRAVGILTDGEWRPC